MARRGDPEQLPDDAASAVEHVLQFPAAQLWVERAAMARPGFHLRQREEALAVARICQRLDGVPLAQGSVWPLSARGRARMGLMAESARRTSAAPISAH